MSLQQSSMASARDSAIPSTSSAMAIMPCMGHGDAGTCHAANPCKGSSRHRTRTSKRRMAGFYGAQTHCACLIGKPAQTRHRRLFRASQSVLGGQRGHCCTCAVGGSWRRPAVTPSANTRCNWSCHCRNGGVAGSDAHVACGGVGSLQRVAGRVHDLCPSAAGKGAAFTRERGTVVAPSPLHLSQRGDRHGNDAGRLAMVSCLLAAVGRMVVAHPH